MHNRILKRPCKNIACQDLCTSLLISCSDSVFPPVQDASLQKYVAAERSNVHCCQFILYKLHTIAVTELIADGPPTGTIDCVVAHVAGLHGPSYIFFTTRDLCMVHQNGRMTQRYCICCATDNMCCAVQCISIAQNQSHWRITSRHTQHCE